MADKYKGKGLRILAFPCNQFGGQEPGTHQEIIEFTKTFDPDMPEKLEFFEKGDVNGANTREVFGFLKHTLPNDDGTTGIRWNFAKFLVDHEGKPYKRFSPQIAPNDMVVDIDELLNKRSSPN
ncbi:Glutathione peroxidase [Seminavis robusta]|uniref:Glutathione peroxidase n=1 Tax=Seminavis robusta TaxID=568900 RepID=A0A9N8DPB2_9STRA|nr:Glutathione peroxidase [Seminavis robusta]CAB9524652.1 Glutathione peroxidase [Seminavis robusta]|eukprot:Sro1565_g282790.1 Glutathione peroxidase (123) ;mRNA; r:68-644